jgi:N-acetyl-gamma-glutamyl-phosphate reductase
MSRRLFIDGAWGTVGMMAQRGAISLAKEGVLSLSDIVVLPEEQRRDVGARKAAMARADVVLLCLPDESAVEAVAMVNEVNPQARILDASAAHRCAEGWVYGLPEVTSPEAIRNASRVANPGCFATGCILIARPLSRYLQDSEFASGMLMVNNQPWMAFQGITGYSANGSRYKGATADMPYMTQLGLEHRHLAEIAEYGEVVPTLSVVVAEHYRGMLVQASVPLNARLIYRLLDGYYADSKDVIISNATDGDRRLSAQVANLTDQVHIKVSAQSNGTVIAASFDNLGKGSAGAALANLRLMLS